MNILSREEVLNRLLKPIVWDWSSSVFARQNLVTSLRSKVYDILPFLNPEELERAKKWLSEEQHHGLWD